MPTNFNISLNREQKEAKAKILNNKVTYITGLSGSGKTLLASQIALDLLNKREISNIILTKPLVDSGESLGYLPGEVKDKMDPYLQSIYQNLYKISTKEKIQSLIEKNIIQIVPFAYMRGITFTNSVIIADEIQNTTLEQTKMLLERVGINTKLLLCGDIKQIDLKNKLSSGVSFLDYIDSKNIDGYLKIKLNSNHRDVIIKEFEKVYDEYQKLPLLNKK